MVIAIILVVIAGAVLIQVIALPWALYLTWKYNDARWERKHPGKPNPGHLLMGRPDDPALPRDPLLRTTGRARRWHRRLTR